VPRYRLNYTTGPAKLSWGNQATAVFVSRRSNRGLRHPAVSVYLELRAGASEL